MATKFTSLELPDEEDQIFTELATIPTTEQLTFAELERLEPKQLAERLIGIDRQYQLMLSKILWTLRQKIRSNIEWKMFLDSVLPEWKNTVSVTQQARYIALGGFLHRHGIESLTTQRISLTCLYALAACKDVVIADDLYKQYKNKPVKTKTLEQKIDKLEMNKPVVATIDKPPIDIDNLTESEKIKFEKQQLIERDKLLKLEYRKKEKLKNKIERLQEKRQEIDEELSELQDLDITQESHSHPVNVFNNVPLSVDENFMLDSLVAESNSYEINKQAIHNLLDKMNISIDEKIHLLNGVLEDF